MKWTEKADKILYKTTWKLFTFKAEATYSIYGYR